MRVVHFVESFSPLTETFIYDFVMEVQRQGIESWVLTLKRKNTAARPFDNVTEITLPPRWSPERLWSRLSVWTESTGPDEQYSRILQRRIMRFLDSCRPDVVHAHFGPAAYLILPVAQALEIPLAVSFYGYDVTRLARSEDWRHRYGQLFGHAGALVALSNTMRGQLHELDGPISNLRVVHLAKRLAEYPYREPVSSITDWVSVGRLAEKKGHLDCIEAFEVATRGTEATLTIIGEGELRSALMDQVESRMLGQRIFFAGALPHHNVVEKLRVADAFVLCSKTAADGDSEGTPTVLLEAQAVGLPCVATRHSAIPEVIPAENHRFLAEEGNVLDIAARMMLLSEASREELLSISMAGRRKVEQEHDLGKEAAKLLQIYSLLTSRGSSIGRSTA
jgi:glycosyltransferase involved in cell wall biosynthesis